jgi:Eukaryotic cytochrome b561
VHLILNIIALVTLIAGLIAVVESKVYVGREQFYTAHAWVGGLTIILSVVQVIWFPHSYVLANADAKLVPIWMYSGPWLN